MQRTNIKGLSARWLTRATSLTSAAFLALATSVSGADRNKSHNGQLRLRAARSIEVGKLADLIVLDRNLLKIPPREIAAVKVLLTVVGGHVVYQGPEFEGAN